MVRSINVGPMIEITRTPHRMTDESSLLVGDDEPEIRETMREYFEFCGFEVYAVHDGESMRKVMGQRRIDVVLMDINLRAKTGLPSPVSCAPRIVWGSSW
jgi:DNA-binding NtrC family response regulator